MLTSMLSYRHHRSDSIILGLTKCARKPMKQHGTPTLRTNRHSTRNRPCAQRLAQSHMDLQCQCTCTAIAKNPPRCRGANMRFPLSGLTLTMCFLSPQHSYNRPPHGPPKALSRVSIMLKCCTRRCTNPLSRRSNCCRRQRAQFTMPPHTLCKVILKRFLVQVSIRLI